MLPARLGKRWIGALLLAAPVMGPAQITVVDFQPSTVFVRAGRTWTLQAAITPARYGPRDLDWSSQDDSIARVDGGGTLTALRAGRTYVYAMGGVHHEANDMCRVIVYDDSNSLRFAPRGTALDAAGRTRARFDLALPRDDIVALVCRVRPASGQSAAATVRMDDGPELTVNLPAGDGHWQDASPMFRYPFGGFYRFGLTAGHHRLEVSLPPGAVLGEIRLVGETGAHDRYESHESAVMGERRWYRIFLPPDYDATRDRLPVIYFLHGWGGRVFKEGVPGSHIDLGEVARRVERDRVIYVMADGQVFWDGGEKMTHYAPYNVFLPHESPFLWEDYFPELVRHIDSAYRTVPDRAHRALLGFSMGGLMSYRIAERFPQLIGSVNPLCGSTESFLGTPADTAYVRVADGVENLHGVRLRIHDTQSDYLRAGNERVWRAAQREELPDTAWALFPGTHEVDAAGKTVAFTQAFEWAVDGFRRPMPPPRRWHAREFLPQFEVWGYRVSCTPARYGLTELHGVTAGGFRVATQSALPDGAPRPGATVRIETGARYRPDTDYDLSDYDEATGSLSQRRVRSDGAGRITLEVDGAPHQIGLHRPGDPAEVVVLGGLAGSAGLLPVGRTATLQVRLYNRGASAARGLTGFVASPEPGVEIARPDFAVAELAPGATTEVSVPVVAAVEPPKYAAPFAVRFDVKVRARSGGSWNDEMNVVPFYAAPKLDVVVEGGSGGALRPGETFTLRAKGRLLRVYSDDPYVVKVGDVPIITDDPENAAEYSRMRLAPECPPGHVVRCLVRAETVVRDIRSEALEWGRAEIPVR